MHFDHWQRWGIALDDVSFANAWLALGLAWPGRRSVAELRHSRLEPSAHWWFPQPSDPIEGTPLDWAQAWRDIQPSLKAPLRVRVARDAADEPILPWYRLLSETQPGVASVSLWAGSPRAALDMQWPLRVGALDDASWHAVSPIEAGKLWPAEKIARAVRLGREYANCDVLLHNGPLKSLAQALLDLPYRVRANMIVVHADATGEWGDQRTLLSTVLGLTRASGFALVPAAVSDDGLAELLNGLAAELSHALPIDIAFANVARYHKQADIVAGFSDQLTEFTLPDLAVRYNARLTALPAGTVLDLSRVGQNNEWLTRGVFGGGTTGGTLKAAMAAPQADRQLAADSVRVMPEEMRFDHEHEGGATMAELGEAMATAEAPPDAQGRRAARFLQQKSFVRTRDGLREASKGFLAGVPAIVRVRIGQAEQGWDANPVSFPVEELPQHLERWSLTVWLTEPDHFPRPLKRRIRLPRDGNSTEAEFLFKPRDLPSFEARITVLHRGRVIQTALLRAAVVSDAYPARDGGAPKLADAVAVRHRLGELDARRQFDLALVANHDSRGRPLLAALSANAAWVKDLTQVADIAREINASFAPVAQSVPDYVDGLDGKNGVEFLIGLARHGKWLKTYLNQMFDDPANHLATTKAEYIQIVSTRVDSVVPIEFVYDYAAPADGAKVCKDWRNAVKSGRCSASCDHASDASVCPLGFWGLQKVIERHAVRPGLAKDGNVLYLQSEPAGRRDRLHIGGASVLGASDRVSNADLGKLGKVIEKHCEAKPELAKTWDAWRKLVEKLHPALLVALPHTDGRATNVTVEIGGDSLRTITLGPNHVFPPPVAGRQAPLVALIGCDVAGTADDYGNHVLVFRENGAAVVIGTIATVFGGHAAKVASKLVEGMLPRGQDKPVRLGELIRQVRRDALLDNLLMPLCLVAYGDADWILARKTDG